MASSWYRDDIVRMLTCRDSVSFHNMMDHEDSTPLYNLHTATYRYVREHEHEYVAHTLASLFFFKPSHFGGNICEIGLGQATSCSGLSHMLGQA